MPAVAHERGLVPDRLEVDGLPGAAHVCELLLVREDGRERLRHLEDVQEAHY